jgi:hypothetical protein
MDRSCLLGFLVLELGCSPCSTPNSPSLFSSWTSVASKDRPRGVAVSRCLQIHTNPYKNLWEAIPLQKPQQKMVEAAGIESRMGDSRLCAKMR